jgi:hypothetical protein
LAAVRLKNGRVSELLRWWWNGASRWNWNIASREESVAAGPRTGRSNILGTWSAQQLLAASEAQRVRMRLSVLRIQGLALTKGGPWRLIPMLATLNYQSSTTLKARASSAATLGRDCMVLRRRSEGCRGPKGVGWQGVAGGSAAAENAVRLVGGGPNVDAHSWLHGYRPSSASTSLCAATMSSGALPASNEEEERREGDRPAQTTRPPWWGPEHGGNVQEHTGITRLSIDRSLRPRQARSVQAGPSSQQQGSGQPCTQPSRIVRTDPVIVSATFLSSTGGRSTHADSKAPGQKSSTAGSGPGKDGRDEQAAASRLFAADRCRRRSQTGADASRRQRSICPYMGTRRAEGWSAAARRPARSRLDSGERDLWQRATRAGSVLQGSKAWLLVASPRRLPPYPPLPPPSNPMGGSAANGEISLAEFSTKVHLQKRSSRRQEMWTPDPFQLQELLKTRYPAFSPALTALFARAVDIGPFFALGRAWECA